LFILGHNVGTKNPSKSSKVLKGRIKPSFQ